MTLTYSSCIYHLKCILLTVHWFPEATVGGEPGCEGPFMLLAALIRDRAPMVWGPYESALFIIIRDRAPMVRGPYWICSVYYYYYYYYYYFPNLIAFLRPKHARKVTKLCTRPEVAKIYIWYGFQKWVWQNGSTAPPITLSTVCASSYVSRTCMKIGTLM